MEKEIKNELYSFDVFDTLITRKTAVPSGIFAIMQEKLKENDNVPLLVKDNFYSIRIQSEALSRRIAYKQTLSSEICIDDIYNLIKEKYSLQDELNEYLKNLEIQTEIENIVPIEENILKLKKLIKENKKVVLISDMYLKSETLRSILVSIDKVFEDIKIYVSCEYKATKSSGKLYKIVKNEEKIKYKLWHHFGDNFKSDVENAKKFGIKAIKFNYPELKGYEKEVINSFDADVLTQFQVGASKFLRLNNKEIINRDKYDFGASFSGPFLYNYVNYVLETSLLNGFKTLYFIARDGYIPKLMADIIIKKKNLPIKTRYIYGSRLAWRIPCRENYEKLTNTFFYESYELSSKLLSYRYHVPVSLILKYTHFKMSDEQISDKEKEDIKNIFLYNQDLKNEIIELNKDRLNLLKEYLKQEIDFSEGQIAFVDINGTGRTLEIISPLIDSISPCSKVIFYATGVINDLFVDNIQKNIFLDKNGNYNSYLELICRTNYGQTIDYKKKNNKIIPVMEENANTIIKWGYNEHLKGILDFVENVGDFKNYSCNKDLCYLYFNFIDKKCDKQTADIIGDIPYKKIGEEKDCPKTAPKLTLFRKLEYLFNKKSIEKYSQYPHFSLIRSNMKNKMPKSRLKFDFMAELKLLYLIKKLKNKKLVLWGASVFLENFIKKYKITSANIVAIVDKNELLHNTNLGIYRIVSPETLKSIDFNCLVMTIKNGNQKIYPEICDFIKANYNNITVLPNIFNDLASLFFNVDKQKTKLENIEYKLSNLENNINRLIQNNLSTFQLHQKTFLPFKNIHKGREIVILATGPSAKFYKPIEGAVHIGVNRAFQINKTDLDYVFVQDYSGKTPEYIKELNQYNKDKCIKFYGLTTEWQEYPNRVIPESDAIEANALRYRTDWGKIENFTPQFAYDIAAYPLGCFGSVTFPALQFALWTNPKRIYLVGCDCSLSGYAYNALEHNFLLPNKLIKAYKKFKEFVYKYYPETEIVSVNPVGLKGIFKDIYMQNSENRVVGG